MTRPDAPPIGQGLTPDFLAYAGSRLWGVVALIVVGAFADGFGIVMLVPILGIVLAAEDSVGAQMVDRTFSAVGITGETAQLLWVLALFAVLLMLRFWVFYRRELVISRLELGFVAHVRGHLFSLIADQPWREARALEQGRLIHLLSRDIDRTASAATLALRVISLGLTFTVQLVLAFVLAPLVAAMVVAAGAVVFLLLRPLRRRAETLGQRLSREDRTLFTSVSEFLRGLKSAKAHGLEEPYLDRLGTAANAYADQHLAALRDRLLGSLGVQAAAALIAVTAIVIGHIWLAAEVSLLIVVLLILARLAGPLQSAQSLLQTALHGRAAYNGAMDEAAGMAATRVALAPPGAPLTEAPGFAVTGLGWTPLGGAMPVLRGLDATVPAGQVTAIAGPSGAGKSTLCDLLAGLLVPDAGTIALDGAPLDAPLRRRLQASLAYVGQDGSLLQPTVRAMLLWGAPRGTGDDALWQALDRVGATDLVRAAEGGLDAPLQGEASRFSGGERQRLRLARALLRRPRLIVLDEATNALDPAAEQAVLGAVFAARDGATVIMVSHREATVALADHVIRLEPAAPA